MHPPSSNPSPASGSAHQRRGQTYRLKRYRKNKAFDSLTEQLVAAMLTLLSTIGFAHDLPYAQSQK